MARKYPAVFGIKLTCTELSEIFSVSHTTVQRWVREGAVPCEWTLGRHMRFDPNAVRKALEARGDPVPKEIIELTGRQAALALAQLKARRIGRPDYEPTRLARARLRAALADDDEDTGT